MCFAGMDWDCIDYYRMEEDNCDFVGVVVG